MKTVAIIGIGLIGGSMGMGLKDKGYAKYIIGVDSDPEHVRKAIEMGLVDEICELEASIRRSDIIVLAVPVDTIENLLPKVLEQVESQIVLDVGSIKKNVIDCIKDHPKRKRFVASHPMWGTEYSGPEAAVNGGFRNKTVILCNTDECDADALAGAEKLYDSLGMHKVYMEADVHDMHVAYVSHISHVASFALANTVLKKEKEEETIFNLASGGFESTVRLAKSSAAMWVPILIQNRNYLLEVLNEYITQLEDFRRGLKEANDAEVESLILRANSIRRIIK